MMLTLVDMLRKPLATVGALSVAPLMLGLLLMSAQAFPPPGEIAPPTDPETVRGDFNRVSAERAELVAKVRDQERELDAIWRDPRFSDPEIEALREQLAILETQAATLRAELTRRAEALPEVKARRERLAADRLALEGATRRRDALAAVLQKLRGGE